MVFFFFDFKSDFGSADFANKMLTELALGLKSPYGLNIDFALGIEMHLSIPSGKRPFCEARPKRLQCKARPTGKCPKEPRI